MHALVVDTSDPWEQSRGFTKREVPTPKLSDPADREAVVIKVRYAGVCGSDRGIWHRQAFRDQILGSTARERKPYRIIGHELCGEIVDAGSVASERFGLRRGDFVSAESHVVCNECFQCRLDEKHVCMNEKILGISTDGCFAEYIKVPAHIVWRTDKGKIRPEVAAVQEPFGNAVHAASKVPLAGKTVAIFGLGPIGLFTLLIARATGAKRIIGVEPNPANQELARSLGIDEVIPLSVSSGASPVKHDQSLAEAVFNLTSGVGADVSFEMAGFNASVNNAIASTRRGGSVVLFGIKQGDFVIEEYGHLIVRGLTLHATIGRELWRTWETTRRLLEDTRNGIQEQIYRVILNGGQGIILPLKSYDPVKFEEALGRNVKLLVEP